jgi:hypothetical protein
VQGCNGDNHEENARRLFSSEISAWAYCATRKTVLSVLLGEDRFLLREGHHIRRLLKKSLATWSNNLSVQPLWLSESQREITPKNLTTEAQATEIAQRRQLIEGLNGV